MTKDRRICDRLLTPVKWRDKAKPNILNETDRQIIREYYIAGHTMTSLAELYGVAISTISRIINNQGKKNV